MYACDFFPRNFILGSLSENTEKQLESIYRELFRPSIIKFFNLVLDFKKLKPKANSFFFAPKLLTDTPKVVSYREDLRKFLKDKPNLTEEQIKKIYSFFKKPSLRKQKFLQIQDAIYLLSIRNQIYESLRGLFDELEDLKQNREIKPGEGLETPDELSLQKKLNDFKILDHQD